jgi:carbonic anhydrase
MVSLNRILRALALVLFGAAVLAAQQASHNEGQKHWGYSNEGGAVPPADWGSLPGAETCGTGHEQSPIDLASKTPVSKAAGPAFDYHPSALAIVNNGHTEQINVDPSSTITIAGQTYKLAQFHFHAPSEHTIDGRHFPLEIHFVHVNDANQPAVVVGVLVQAGAQNLVLDPAMTHLPGQEGATAAFQGPVDLGRALPSASGFWHYAGSLTTPPCTEHIQWYVMERPVEMSSAEIAAFTKVPHMAHTDRPVQSSTGRTIEHVVR